ncbi:uncharacterized protein BKA55DRAFT_532414 [Fusarium redolens]|uniref:DUF7053 domain-containing protein n=1 Tax=Fusarium redolens TaxID=48865 RepID=A0A9P9R8J7_FUSRE|nr:uncharacterized protein BKA55DRAFT_532414 [Fusarium redolens]KAH7269782.1 hypothetical protein BKA55DRAFT_532414 [Fusarium redolens]
MFQTTAQIQHTSPISSVAAAPKAIQMLHDHVFFLHCNPYMSKFEAIHTPDPTPSVPDTLEVKPIAAPDCYSVTDRIHTLPAGLWDSDVVSSYEFFDLERGVFVRTRGPMGLVLETLWRIQEAEDGSLAIVEKVSITCSRLMMGMIKSSCEAGWRGVHGKMLERIEESYK